MNTEDKKWMVCPLMDICNKKVIWDRPLGDGLTKLCTQGHCKKHHELETCVAGKNCPACVPFKS